uniref:Floricaula/leafy-like transcription factor n=1 Tax=Picea sitchensis TaxID=3332 RepID=A9P2C1_PICSI|nr:unknown [Picea sitchensis]ACN40517.1 unknown [Picea sitchensis]
MQSHWMVERSLGLEVFWRSALHSTSEKNMDAEHFPVGFFRWDQRPAPAAAAPAATTTVFNKDHGRPLEIILPMNGRKELKSLEDLFREYGVRYSTLAKMTEMGFTANTLVNMTEEEIEDLMKTLVEIYHMDLLIGERYGIKSAIRAEKKRLQDCLEMQRLEILSEAERKRILHDDQNTFAAAMTSEGYKSSVSSCQAQWCCLHKQT